MLPPICSLLAFWKPDVGYDQSSVDATIFLVALEADHILDGLMLVTHHQKGAVVYLHYSLGWIIPINFQTSSHLFIVLIYSSSCLH